MAIGNNVHIGKGCLFDAAGGLTIGDNTHISHNVTILTSNHNYECEVLPYDKLQNPKPVAIGRNVWIGMNVSIIPGVGIGDGAIIGLGTVVSKDVPPGAIVGSAPQRVLKTRDNEHYTKLEVQKRYGGASGHILSREELNKFKLHPSQKEGNLFFVVSTGRSGTQTIAEVLSQHPEIECVHEGRPQLIRLSTELAYGLKTIKEAKQELYDIYSTICVPSTIYGESSQKLWNLIPILNMLFPKCKLIWLIRNGLDVVASNYTRRWYSIRQQELGHPTKPGI